MFHKYKNLEGKTPPFVTTFLCKVAAAIGAVAYLPFAPEREVVAFVSVHIFLGPIRRTSTLIALIISCINVVAIKGGRPEELVTRIQCAAQRHTGFEFVEVRVVAHHHFKPNQMIIIGCTDLANDVYPPL